jgi:hypothetical protein
MKVMELDNGLFDVVDDSGTSLMEPFGGPCVDREYAVVIARMLELFGRVEKRIGEINDRLQTEDRPGRTL